MADHVHTPPGDPGPERDPGHGPHHTHPHHAGGAAHVSAHNPGAGQGPVVLDLGDDVGALILHTGPDMVGREIDISPAADRDTRRHVEVLPRRTAAGVRFSAVYGSLREGPWTLWHDATTPALDVFVQGGHVTEAQWPPERPGGSGGDPG